MSELFRYIDFPDEPAEFHSASEELDAARAELARLRSDNAELSATVAEQNRLLDDYAETIRMHEITITEQERRIAEARELEKYVRGLNDYEVEFTTCPVCDYPPIVCECAYSAIRAWIRKYPAPQDEARR